MNGQLARYRAFQEVARTKSFTEAAVVLGYSQSAVSRLVSELEREWGVQLFERSRAGVSLTNEGAQLLPSAQTLCQAEAEFHAQVDRLHNLSSGIIRIGTISSTATHWLPSIIASFQSEYPGIRYELFLGDYSELEAALSSGRIDCAFTRLPVEGPYNCLPLQQDELMAVLPKDHPLASEEAIDPGFLAVEPFIHLKRGSSDEVSEVLQACKSKPEPRFTTWDDYAVMSMVEAGLGVSVLPSLVLRRTPYHIAVRPLSPRFFRTLGFVTRKTTATPLAVKRFMDHLGSRKDS